MPNSNATLTRSGVLVIGANSIQSLLPASLISQVEALLQSHRVQEAAELADQQRRKLETKLAVAEDELEELNYVYQRIGFQCFSETLFEDAGLHFSMGNMDPRILISYFPELRGGLFKAGDEVPMFSGVAEHIPLDASVDDLIAANLVRNYSPHIAPNTRDAPATAELRQILKANAGQMLSDFLRKWRRANRREAARVVLATVDTVLAKLFARDEKTTDLYALIREKHAIVVEEVEGMFISTGQYNALCQLFQQRGMDENCSTLGQSSWSDEDIPDPLGNMVTLLNKKKDRSLTQKWGLWLTARDPEQGIKLLTAREPGRRNTKTTATLEEDVALLQQIQESNPIAGAHFLGHLVLTRRSTDKNLHTQLAMLCVDHLEAALSDSSTSKLWRAKVASYASTPSNQSFLSYFAATTPNSEHKRARLKAALFLQGSNFYDLEKIRDRIKEHESILRLELAMVEGKSRPTLGNDREALSILVHGLHDAASAEVYCSFGGQVIPPRTAQMLGEEYDLRNWASLFVPHISKGHAESVPGQAAVDEDTKKKLVRMLLEVNMSGGDGAAERTTRMLDAQAMNLDVSDVIKLVPDDWRLNLMSSFLTRSLRRTLHAKHEGMIVKNVSMAQNLEVVDQTWEIVRQEGAIIEEAVDCSDDEGADEKVEKEPAEYPFPDVTRQGHIVNAMGEKAAMDPVDPVDHEMLDLR